MLSDKSKRYCDLVTLLWSPGSDIGFFAWRGGILASDSISGLDFGCFGLLVVLVLWYLDIVPDTL